ncbi:MAG TPA: glycosyltransferase family 39 protein [Longimicrobiales bacterium]
MALAIRLIRLDHTVQVDELNHVLAARSLLEDGTLRLGEDGMLYTRARGFTYLIAAIFRLFGESVVVARIPAVLAGTALVAALFLFTRSVAGRAAAWLAALFLCFDPTAIYLSQLTRFYTIHALLFLLGAIAVFRLCTSPLSPARRAALIAGALVAFGIAYHLQVTTVIGLGGVTSAAVLLRARRETLAALGRRWRWWLPALLVASLPAAFMARRMAPRYLELFTYADPWAAGFVDDPLYYLRFWLEGYPTMWSLLPIVLVVALYRHPRFATFAGAIFLVAFATHSLAAWKNPRFLFYSMPFLFALWGIAAAAALRWTSRRVRALWRNVPWLSAAPGLAAAATKASLALVIGYLLTANSAYRLSYKMLTVDDRDWAAPILYRGEPDWAAAADELRTIVDSSAVIVSSSDLKALFYLGRIDVVLSANGLGSGPEALPDFSIASNVNRPTIQQPESLARLMACQRSGLVIVEDKHLGQTWSVPPATAAYLRDHTETLPLPAGLRLTAFRWRNPEADASACPAGVSSLPSR